MTRWIDYLSRYGPVAVLLPLLTAKIPVQYHGAREIAGYFQSLAFARTGFNSYFYLTPEESFSALHLHSVLSSPLVALGYTEGGRLISLIAAVIAVTIVAYLANELFGPRAALLAPAILWAHPLFLRFSYLYWPETLSIALTVGGIYSALYYVRTRELRWFGLVLGLLSLAITNHMWEATIALPLFAVLLHQRRYIEAGAVSAVAAGIAGAVWWLTELQPSGASSLTQYGIQAQPDIIFNAGWWLSHWNLHPFNIITTVTLPMAVLCFGVWVYRWHRTRSLESVLLSSWLASGLIIPIALANGYIYHTYYIWALLAPVSISIAVFLQVVLRELALHGTVTPARIVTPIIFVLVGSALLYGVIFEAGALSGTPVPMMGNVDGTADSSLSGVNQEEAVKAGIAVREQGVDSPTQIVFIGEWSTNSRFGRQLALSRVLIYSDVLIKHRNMEDAAIIRTTRSSTNCTVAVERSGSSISVHPC